MIDRHHYVEKLKARLDEWDRELDVLEARLKETRCEAEQRSQKAMADLKQTRQQLGQRVDELVTTSDEAWQRIRLSVDTAWENVKSGLAAVRAELIPPEQPGK